MINNLAAKFMLILCYTFKAVWAVIIMLCIFLYLYGVLTIFVRFLYSRKVDNLKKSLEDEKVITFATILLVLIFLMWYVPNIFLGNIDVG